MRALGAWAAVLVALVWIPLLVALPQPMALGCARGAADSPWALLRFVAGGQAVAASPPPPPGPSPVAGKHLQIVIDAGTRRLYLFADGEPFKSWPVAVGTRDTPTPIGHWSIKNKAIWGGAFGARWMQISIPWGTYGIHGTNNPGSIGSRASHGCVRMFNRNVVELYGLVSVGTPIDIRGTPVARFGEVRRVIVPTLVGSDVLQVQRALQALGYDTGGRLSGVYAGKWVDAVKRFQESAGLKPTGVVDYTTAEKLGLRPLVDDPSLRPTPKGAPVEPPPPRPADVPPPAPGGPRPSTPGPGVPAGTGAA